MDWFLYDNGLSHERVKDSPKIPYSPPELPSELMKGAICVLLNTVFTTLHDRIRKNEFGYVLTNSPILACKT